MCDACKVRACEGLADLDTLLSTAEKMKRAIQDIEGLTPPSLSRFNKPRKLTFGFAQVRGHAQR